MIRWRLLLLWLLLPTLAQAGDYYTHGSFPAPGSQATSAGMRAELDLIQAGFDKLPALTGNANKIVMVNGSGTGLTTAAGTITIPVSLTISGSYGLTWNLSNTTSLTLPTSGTLSTIAGSETLSNKILSAPTFSGTAVGPLNLTGDLVATGEFEFTGSDNYAIGTTRAAGSKLLLGGTYTADPGLWGVGLNFGPNITGATNQTIIGAYIRPTLTTAGGGTHDTLEALRVDPPTVVGNGAAITTAVSLHVTGAPSGASSNKAVLVEGLTHINGTLQVGSTQSSNSFVNINTSFTPSGATWSSGLTVRPTIQLEVGQDSYGQVIIPTFTKAASGTNSFVAGIDIDAPIIQGSGSTITNAASLYITGAPSGATNNYAIWASSGTSRLDSLTLNKGLSRSGSSAQPQNLAGTCTFVASTTCTVTFTNTEPDANYLVTLGCDTQCGRWGSRTTNGFTITTSTSNSGTCHWMIIR